jgi:signal peptidase II
MTQLASWGRLGGVALAAYALDLLTKMMAERSLTLHEPVPLIGQFFRLTLGYNTGVAFSLFADSGPAAGILSGLIILGILVWVGLQIRADRMPLRAVVPFGLIIGGALGNFFDRLVDGRVTDFLDVGVGSARWPTFNIADVALSVAIAALFLLSLRAFPDTASQAAKQARH